MAAAERIVNNFQLLHLSGPAFDCTNLSRRHFDYDTANRPYVDRTAVANRMVFGEYFWCHVRLRSDVALQLAGDGRVRLNLDRAAEVAQLQRIARFCEEYIRGFDVSVDHSVTVQLGDGVEQLGRETTREHFMESSGHFD